MAFQKAKFVRFYGLLKEVQNFHPEVRGVAENFILEERLTDVRQDSYGEYVATSMNSGDWQMGHENYLSEKINISQRTLPETFSDSNHHNLLPNIDKDQFLLRLENIAWLCPIIGLTENELIDKLRQFLQKPLDKERNAPIHIIEKLLADWNRIRDARPIFAGFWGEAKDLFTDRDGNEIVNDDWANKLRDRFGLGHLDPENKAPTPVLLLRYRVDDVVNAKPEESKSMAIPTVLESKWSFCFCPTPVKGWREGQTFDLSSGTANDYLFNCEIVHRFIEYSGSYFYRVGWITQSPGRTCEQAREIHYQYLSDDFKNFVELQR